MKMQAIAKTRKHTSGPCAKQLC